MHGARRARDDRVMQRKNMQRTSATLLRAHDPAGVRDSIFRTHDPSGVRDAVAATVIEDGRCLPRGIPFIPLNPAESRMQINLLLRIVRPRTVTEDARDATQAVTVVRNPG